MRGAHRVEHTESHQIIEEFMLAGNQAVSTWLDDLGLNHLHRITILHQIVANCGNFPALSKTWVSMPALSKVDSIFKRF